MIKQKHKKEKAFPRRGSQIKRFVEIKLRHYFWHCYKISLFPSLLLFALVGLLFALAFFDCFRQMNCSGFCLWNVRSCPLGNHLADTANCITVWLANIFCIPENGCVLIRISPDCLTLSIEDASLSLAPAQVFLTTIGTGGVTLSAISEYRARRHLGVSMRDVLSRYYPGHMFFMVMQIALYVLGTYTIAKGMVRCSMLALLGAFLCATYSIAFAFGAFSAEKLAQCYICAMAKKVKKHHSIKDLKDSTKSKRYLNDFRSSLISNCSFHIGKDYAENSRDLASWFRLYCVRFVSLIDLPLKRGRGEDADPSLFKFSYWDENQIFQRCFFPTTKKRMELNNSNMADFVLYGVARSTKFEEPHACSFESRLYTAQLTWKNLLRPFGEDDQGKAEAAAAMLTASYIHSYPSFVSLVCGLSLYQRDIGSAQTNGKKRADFLDQVLKQSQILQQQLCYNGTWIKKNCYVPHFVTCTQDQWKPYRKILGLIELSITLWEYALYGMDLPDVRENAYNTLLEIADYSDSPNPEILWQDVQLYTAYGYATYSEAIPESRRCISRAYMPKLLHYLKGMLYQKIRNID